MLRIYYGETGTGKSKRIISECNDRVERANGTIVYVDDDKTHSREISYKIRFIDASDYSIDNPEAFYGFLSGIAAQDHDLEAIYVDGFSDLVKTELMKMNDFFAKLHVFVEKVDIDVYLSINGKEGELPSFLTPYTVECK